MKKESRKDMKLIISNPDVDEKTDFKDSVETNYQSDPIKVDLYSKLLAFHKSQKKFSIKDLIKDNLK